MDIFLISLLVLLGIFFCLVELLILPGITLGGILSIGCYGGAIYMAFNNLSLGGAIVVTVIIALLSLLAIIISLRAKTWDRFSLKSKIDSASSLSPQSRVAVGDSGVATSRLSPMGRVEIEGQSYEAKSHSSYIDAKTRVEVVGFDNFSVIVKPIDQK
ncbi:MAG: NfeD family protein [Rikenellaceae bacterium]